MSAALLVLLVLIQFRTIVPAKRPEHRANTAFLFQEARPIVRRRQPGKIELAGSTVWLGCTTDPAGLRLRSNDGESELVAGVDAGGMTKPSGADAGAARRIRRDVVNDVVRAAGIARHAAYRRHRS